MSRFSVIAGRGGESRLVGRYETFEDCCAAAESMLRQGELVDLLDEWEQLGDEPGYAGADRDGKRAWVREALKSGRLVATGEAVALIPEE